MWMREPISASAGLDLIRSGSRRRQRDSLLVVCAYNEANSLPYLLDAVSDHDTLVVDDGSIDGTHRVVSRSGAALVVHPTRLGKSFSLQDALGYASSQGYKVVIEIDADAIPGSRAVSSLIKAVAREDVGGASVWQVPIGPRNVSYFLDELIWSMLNHGKRAQQALSGSCHTGGVMNAFKIDYVPRVSGAINDDEQICIALRSRRLKTVLVQDAVAYFDASSSIGHIMQRRRRMVTGHMVYSKSTAPSMDATALGMAVFWSIREKPSRLPWLVPAVMLELVSRLLAWKDSRDSVALERTKHWVTTYEKNRISDIRDSSIR